MKAAALAAAALAAAGLVSVADTAAAASVPGAPATCTATAAGAAADVSWTAPASDGGAAVTRYVVKIKGQSTPVVQIDDGTARAYHWTTAYQAASVFQVRAVNSVGFGAWCEAPLGAAPPPPPPPPGDYEPGSWLYTAPGPTDQAATSAMQSFLHTFADQQATPYPLLNGVAGNAWGMVYATGTAADPVWKLTGTVPAAVSTLATTGFHAPAWLGDVLTGTTDSPFMVNDQATGISVWGAKASKGTGYTIKVGAAGYFAHGTNGLDSRAPGSDSTVNYVSRGRIPDTMVITKDQVDTAVAGHTDLGHALEIFWAETDSAAGFKAPMVGAESGQAGWGAEGQRIAIAPTVDLSTRSCSPTAYVIALTLQRHGAYIGDNAGGAATFKMEQESATHPVWGGVTRDELAGCVTWSDFVATQ